MRKKKVNYSGPTVGVLSTPPFGVSFRLTAIEVSWESPKLGLFWPPNQRIFGFVSTDPSVFFSNDGIRNNHGGEFSALVSQRSAVAR